MSTIASAATVPAPTWLMPVLFLSHAAPVLFMKDDPMFGARNDCGIDSPAYKWYQSLPTKMNIAQGERRPKAIVMVSAHYETPGKVMVTAQDKYPSLYYDFYGFPSDLYEIKYDCPGNSSLATKVQSLLNDGPLSALGIKASLDTKRCIDHGGFIPLKLMYPEADIPVLQVSLPSLDPRAVLAIGQSLAPLRAQGVLIMGSGQATHNAFSSFGNPSAGNASKKFVDALTIGLQGGQADQQGGESGKEEKEAKYAKRVSTSLEWKKLPNARDAHPREEHLVPLFACVGASNPNDAVHIVGDHYLMKVHSLRSFAFGDISVPKVTTSPDDQKDNTKSEL